MKNGIDAHDLSQDKAVVEEYINDPLNHPYVSSRWFTEFIDNGDECLRRAAEINLPLPGYSRNKRQAC